MQVLLISTFRNIQFILYKGPLFLFLVFGLHLYVFLVFPFISLF